MQKKYGHKVWLIQDCCHAFGAEWNGRMISTSGDVAIYAFNISKMITSIFGGMLTFQDQMLADKVRAWRDATIALLLGKTNTTRTLLTGGLYGL